MGCSAKNAWTSAATVGSVSRRTEPTMRTMVLVGKAAFASSQCCRTKRHAAAPCLRLAMHRLRRNGAFWVLTSGLIASSHVRSTRASESNSLSALRWRSCSCGLAASW